MDKIRGAIAEKVLEISSSDSSEIKEKLQKINRFRDLTEACQSFIKSYPQIERELLQMIQNNDFDARIASSRIDTIIRFTEKNTTKEAVLEAKQDIENIAENLSDDNANHISANIESKNLANDSELPQYKVQSSVVVEENRMLDAEKDECPKTEEKHLSEPEVDLEKESQYIDFEEIKDSEEQPFIKKNETAYSETKSSDSNTIKISTTKKIIYTILIIAILVLVYYAVVFIIANWKIILWILIGFAVIATLIWYLIKRKN